LRGSLTIDLFSPTMADAAEREPLLEHPSGRARDAARRTLTEIDRSLAR
jgi:hypothetical protein